MSPRKSGAALRILEQAFVRDERKAEIQERLKRVKGQVEGVSRMLGDNRPCVDILTQIAATQEALRGVGRLMVRNYLERCVSAGIKAGHEGDIFDQLMEVIFKLSK